MNATELSNIANRLQSFWDRLANDPVAGTKFEGDSVALEDAIVKLRHIAAAERAVSPAESVQSVDTPEFLALLKTYRKDSNFMSQHDTDAYAILIDHVDAKITAAHAEGRRSAMEELAKLETEKVGLSVRLKDVEDELQEWRFTNKVDELQRAHDAVVEELAKEKERADRAERERGLLAKAIADAALKAGVYNGEVDLTGPHLLMMADDLAGQALAARQAPDIGHLHCYTLNDGQLIPVGIVKSIIDRGDMMLSLLDVRTALLAQPLQREGGKEDKRIAWLEFLVKTYGPKSLQYDIEHPTDGLNSIDPAEVERTMRGSSDNLQQASTAQVEPAKMECPDCGVDRFKMPCPNMADECPMIADAHLLKPAKEAASATDAGQYVPEYKTLTDHNWRVIGVQWVNAADAPAVGTSQATPEGAELPPPKYASVMAIADEFGSGAVAYTANEVRAALAANQQAAEPVYQAFSPSLGAWLDLVSGDEMADYGGAGYQTRILYRAAPPQQVEPECCNHDCNQGRDCPNRKR